MRSLITVVLCLCTVVDVFGQLSTNGNTGRFTRGTGYDPSVQSFVVPLSYQKGVVYDAIGGNATNWYPNNSWTTPLYHYNATNPGPQNSLTDFTGRIPFKNPIAAFGSRVGGSPLYVSERYDFGAYGGNPYTNQASGAVDSFYNQDIYLHVYHKATGTNVAVLLMQPPDTFTTNNWVPYLTNGYTFTHEAYGLQTAISLTPLQRWGSGLPGTYLFSHTASTTATNYFFMIDAIGFAGFVSTQPLMVATTNFGYWSPLYTVEFEARTPNRSRFVDQPQFDGAPLPPAYQGKTVEELLAVKATMPSLSSVSWTNFAALTNQSAELRSHPILDQFVADMGSNALALANYVINEVELADFIDYDTNQNQQTGVYLGGINRSALATFQEGRGSPLEQSALLVYLLRKAGVPAAFIYPTNNGLKMLDIQLSKLFEFQVRNALLLEGLSFMPHQVSVNYPWVAAYLTNESRWVHILPWIKDTEISEGLDLYKLMPTNYNNGHKWLVKYLERDTNIMSLSTVSDQAAVLFPKFIEKQLSVNAPGISLDDVGTKIVHRKNLVSRWDDFAKPFSLTGAVQVVESHRDSTNLFNTMQVRVYCANATNKFIDIGEMRLADLHNRSLTLRTDQVGTNNIHNVTLSLAGYDPTLTNTGTFGTGANPYHRLSSSVQVHSTNDAIRFRTTLRRLKHLGTNYVAAERETNLWNYTYAEPGAQKAGLVYTNENSFRKGDLIGFCLDVGRVTPKMLRVHAEELWRLEQQIATNSTSQTLTDTYLENSTYLMGMSYWEFMDRFHEKSQRLHKLRQVANYSYGFGLLRPDRTNDALPNNGQIRLTTPSLHIPVDGAAFVFNGTLRPDTGRDLFDGFWDYLMINAAAGSAAEHGTVQSFYRTNAVSTVKLLHTTATNMLRLTKYDYQKFRTNVYGSKTLQQHDSNLWSQVEAHFSNNVGSDFYKRALMTPGALTAGSYTGVGAMLLAPSSHAALISGLLNGATGDQFPITTFTPDNSENFGTRANAPGSTTIYGVDLGFNEDDLIFNSVATLDRASIYSDVLNELVFFDPAEVEAAQLGNWLFGTPGSGTANGYNWIYDDGCLATQPSSFLDRVTQFISDPVSVLNGDFYVDELDLRLPGPMPLEVRRNYSSQNLAENQLGFGWKLSYMPFLSVSPSNNLIYAAEPDGSVLAYRQQNPPSGTLWFPTAADNPRLHNMGIGSLGNYFNARIQKIIAGSQTFYYLTNVDGSRRVFEERAYSVGANFERRRPYLNQWFDNRGNSYTFSYGQDATKPDYGQVRRIESSNGSFLGFYYDVYGHVLEVYAGDGRRLFYDYNAFGDLVKVTLPDASERIYEYQHSNFVTNSVTNLYSTHLIARQVKPDGRVLENFYDSQRRVTVQKATVGPDLNTYTNAVFTYSNNFSLTNAHTNLVTGFTLLADAYNRILRYDYTNSLITCISNALGHAILQDWYESFETAKPGYYPRSLESLTDRRGLQTFYKYDASGNATNILVKGDLTGNGNTSEQVVSTAGYDQYNLITNAVNASGNTNRFFYTNTWLVSRVEIQATNAYGANIITNSFAYYNVTNALNASQVAYGLRKREVRADQSSDAATNEWAHDYRGLETQQVRYTRTTNPHITNYFVSNDRGEVVEITDAAGRKQRFAYDGLGRQTVREVYEAGATTPLSWNYAYYNENGDLVWNDGPRFDPEDYNWNDYDGDGRHSQEITWKTRGRADAGGVEAESGYDLFATTFKEYDLFGNLVRSINPRGVVTTNTYDAIGQLKTTKIIDINGTTLSVNGFAYGPGGEVTFQTNALNGVTETTYTYSGRPKSQKNPDGSTNGWTYYADGRELKQFLSNGNFWEMLYDDANRRTTNRFKTGSSVLRTKITELDRRGNVVKSTDFDGSVSTNVFDGLDRIKIDAGPRLVSVAPTNSPGSPGGSITNVVQQIATYSYDASGQTQTVANALGEKTITAYDALGRAVSAEIKNANNVTVRVTQTAYAQNHHGVSLYQGTGTNSIVSTTFTDNDGHPVLTLNYPTNNVWEYVLQRYDLAGNRTERQELSRNGSQITTWATNVWTYDGLNRPVTETVRDGATTTLSYNGLGNITNRAMPAGVTWAAAYNSAGNILTEQESGTNGASSRSFTHQYYPAGNPWAGLLRTVTDGRGVIRSNSYNDSLQLSEVTTTGSSSEHSSTRYLSYTPRGELLWIYEQPDAAIGPAVNVARNYDGYGNLTAEYVSVGSYLRSARQGWDSARRRTSLTMENQRYGFAFRADGLLAGATNGNFSGSYGYTDAGILTNRYNTAREWQMNRRDGMGRILQATTKSGIQTVMTETLAWRGDTRLTNYAAVRSLTDNFTDTRTYKYASFSRDLTQETFYVALNQPVTIDYGIDQGQVGRLGVITSASSSGAATNKWGSAGGGVDGLSRLAQHTNTLARRQASGKARGAGNVLGALNGRLVRVEYDRANTNGPWRADLDLNPGVNALVMTANHPSGLFTTNATSTFTNSIGNVTVTNNYDGNGNVIARVHRNGAGQLIRTETLTWDGFNRLIKESLRDSFTNGYDCANLYDALDRRVRCTHTTISSNAVQNTRTVDFRYDPEHQFMQLGISINGKNYWRVHGPDLNGAYGGLQGIGGLEAIVDEQTTVPTVLINDFFGNVVATNAYGVTASAKFLPNRYTAYGPFEGYQPAALSLNGSVATSFGWLGKPIEPTGKYDFGTRQYEPTERRFLSYDTMGFAGGNNAFMFCDNSPTVHFDPNGTFAQNIYNNGLPMAQVFRAGASIFDNINARAENGFVGGGAEYASYIWNMGADMFTPASYVNSIENRYNNSVEIYDRARSQDDSWLNAAHQVWGYNVGQNIGATPLYEGLSQYDLAAARELDAIESWSRGLRGGGQLIVTAVVIGAPLNPTPANVLPSSGRTFVVDSRGNVIPLQRGQTFTSSPNGQWIQVRDAAGNPTGLRLDGAHGARTHPDPRAQVPHGHVPGVTNPDGTPWLPVNQ